MDAGPRGGKIVGYTSTRKPIYDKYNHPEHKNLKSSELERPMFHAYEQSKYHAGEIRKHSVGSGEYEHHKAQFQQYHAMHKHFSKLWRSALSREKKKVSTTKG